MRRSAILLGLCVCVLAVATLSGPSCSSKKSSTGPTPVVDPTYRLATSSLDATRDLVSLYSFAAITMAGGIADGWGECVYHAGSGYWCEAETYYDTIFDDDGTTILMVSISIQIDSVRFYHGITPVKDPLPWLVTRLECGSYLAGTWQGSTDTIYFRYGFNVTGAPGEILSDNGDVLINGSGTMKGQASTLFALPDESDSLPSNVCGMMFDVTVGYSNIALNNEDMWFDCPTGGTINQTADLDVMYCPGGNHDLDFPATWTAVTTIQDTLWTTVYNDGSKDYTVKTGCIPLIDMGGPVRSVWHQKYDQYASPRR